jgi:hypothetical protein
MLLLDPAVSVTVRDKVLSIRGGELVGGLRLRVDTCSSALKHPTYVQVLLYELYLCLQD